MTDKFQHLIDEIHESKTLLDYQEGWDSEGALPISFNAWLYASNFLINHARQVYKKHKVVIEAPTISAVPDGSVDLCWRKESKFYRLLVNVNDHCISYYGDEYDESVCVKNLILKHGELDKDLCNWMKILEKTLTSVCCHSTI